MTKETLINDAYAHSPALACWLLPRWRAGCSRAEASCRAPTLLTDAPGRAAGQDLKITKFHLFNPIVHAVQQSPLLQITKATF
jgi:hypothetical protein